MARKSLSAQALEVPENGEFEKELDLVGLIERITHGRPSKLV